MAPLVNTAATEPQNVPHAPSNGSNNTTSPVSFEEYLAFAAVQRRQESLASQHQPSSEFEHEKHNPSKDWLGSFSTAKGPNVNLDHSTLDTKYYVEMDQERADAARALRLAGWSSVFFLLTTDILGPFNAPFAISQIGWAPGIILYFVMGIVATYVGLILWRLYIRLDSVKYPVRTFADLAERIFGPWAGHLCTILQTLQLVVNVGVLSLSNGQSLSQITNRHLCFAVCVVIWPFIGIIIGQIRTLRRYGWLANAAVWINLLLIFVSMGFIAHSPPNYEAAQRSLGVEPGPVKTQVVGDLPLYAKVNGIMNMVFAYGGAMIYMEIMAEMRRPMDFWKGTACAQALIFSVYLLYGVFVYHFQGQFTLPLAYQGVARYAWQTVGNVMALITGIIAAGLYGNIGCKVAYINIVEKWFNGPPLMTRTGHMIWAAMVVVYWGIAFIVGSAIPQIQNISGLIAAVCIMQFSYTFPPILRLGYDVITDAMVADGPYVPGQQGLSHRVDTWKEWSRWKRGLFSGRIFFKLFNLVLFLGSLALACLGMWGAGKSVQAGFANSAASTSFSCRSPV